MVSYNFRIIGIQIQQYHNCTHRTGSSRHRRLPIGSTSRPRLPLIFLFINVIAWIPLRNVNLIAPGTRGTVPIVLARLVSSLTLGALAARRRALATLALGAFAILGRRRRRLPGFFPRGLFCGRLGPGGGGRGGWLGPALK